MCTLVGEWQSDVFGDDIEPGYKIETLKHKANVIAADSSRNRPDPMVSILRPSRRYSPSSGRSSEPRMLSRVVLPQPLGPIIAINSPFSIIRSSPSRTVCSASPNPYLFTRPERAITGGTESVAIALYYRGELPPSATVRACVLHNSVIKWLGYE